MAKGKGGNTVEAIESLVKPTLTELGFSIWDIRFEKEGPDWFLRILIDLVDGEMDMDACEKASRAINPIIDEADPIDQSYFMEVGSPGLGRKLTKPEHFVKMQGKEVLVHLIRAENAQRDIVGNLCEKTDTHTVISVDGEQAEFENNNVSYVKLNDDANLF